MFIEAELFQNGFRVHRENFRSLVARIKCQHDGHQTTHDMRIGIAKKLDDRIVAVLWQRLQPDLADAALNLVCSVACIVGIGRQFLAEVDDIAIAVFPIVEKFEIGHDAIDGRGHNTRLKEVSCRLYSHETLQGHGKLALN